ncbi:MAG: flagellar biosynthesis protein FlgJ [Acidimicrobiales bacterium]|nr:flagellar biosynthesis protein FlgJ [Hyphomonadaceae bacterium]RZV44773.1 MAG: flagellar biosynthesis protein FlgJ [Acidimicrobiales bacterium]
MLSTTMPFSNLSIAREADQLSGAIDDKKDQILREKAREFEAVFIGQMLKFSGFDKALTMGGGKDASAFSGMYIQEFAEKIADDGGFGLAEKIYTQMSRRNADAAVIGEQGGEIVFSDRL